MVELDTILGRYDLFPEEAEERKEEGEEQIELLDVSRLKGDFTTGEAFISIVNDKLKIRQVLEYNNIEVMIDPRDFEGGTVYNKIQNALAKLRQSGILC